MTDTFRALCAELLKDAAELRGTTMEENKQ